MSGFTLAVYKFSITPDQNAPGVHGIQQATNEVAMYALLACGIGVDVRVCGRLDRGVPERGLHTRLTCPCCAGSRACYAAAIRW